MKFIAGFVHALQWLAVAASPSLLGAFIGVMMSLQSDQLYSNLVPLWTVIGFIVGAFWAEHVRKTVGLSSFFGRLVGARDLPKNK
ncbi:MULTISPECIES: hypothetical protein [unclassified Shewanella]|uniref:hypothetical protein n=1 Tax=unclassified Shewanella TaxID=196818 RepID=UPI001BC3F684|nr:MULTISPECIES: hypothetical protein [unclassified Shewanella]GIU12032.1 hypothetical protein TUM4444_18960 [Shewanella sp. MBTL60-112-B1]GIU31776.1 hypothetical protein TUM4445_16650 [Shewanella sp. MBTL60-112-B2]